MTCSKYLAGLLVLALGAAAVQAGPPRRQRWSREYIPAESYYPQTVYYPPSTTFSSSMYGSPLMGGPVQMYDATPSSFAPGYVSSGSSSGIVPASYSTPSFSSPSYSPAAGGLGTGTTGEDALAEVNATRAQRGLPPFQPDPMLQQAALACATQRANRMISGHLPESDFAYLPPGAHASSAGCAAWTPDWGWGSCCTYDHYTTAGAAWVMGRDGKRYMHLFVR